MQFSYDQNQISNFALGPKVYGRNRECLLYPTSIEAWKTSPAGDQTYSLLFEDGLTREARGHELLLSSALRQEENATVFSHGDIVLVDVQGKSRKGIVIEHKLKLDQVIIKLDGTGDILVRREKELRLVADALRPRQLKGTRTYFPWQDISEVLRCNGQQETMEGRHNNEQSDVRQAAMALTALSLSPLGPEISKENGKSEQMRFVFPPKEEDTYTRPRYTDTKPRSFSLDSVPSRRREKHRPPFRHQYSVPVTSSNYGPSSPVSFSGPVSPKSFDEGFASSDSSESLDTPPYKKKKSHEERKRKMFVCMWRGCTSVQSSLSEIINHVRISHLRPENGDKYQDGEEEFYFNDIDVESDSDLESGSLKTSPSSDSLSINSSDTDNGKPLINTNNGGSLYFTDERESVHAENKNRDSMGLGDITSPIKLEKANSDKLRKVQSGRVQGHTNRGRPVKSKRRSSSFGEDTRSNKGPINESVKKCRKMYGMESKHLWCTQCKWKKACVRFR